MMFFIAWMAATSLFIVLGAVLCGPALVTEAACASVRIADEQASKIVRIVNVKMLRDRQSIPKFPSTVSLRQPIGRADRHGLKSLDSKPGPNIVTRPARYARVTLAGLGAVRQKPTYKSLRFSDRVCT
jgi:hypothetical protein